jgi:hypothetical protein
MTPKEKAKELVGRYAMYLRANLMHDEEVNEDAKQCASIAVDEILNHHSQEQGLYRIDTYYWQEVKKEIEVL